MELAHKKINGSQMVVHRFVEISRAARMMLEVRRLFSCDSPAPANCTSFFRP